MFRGFATLISLTAIAGFGYACPWWCHRGSPRPVIVYYYYTAPEPVVVDSPPPPEKNADTFDSEALYEKSVASCVFIVTPNKGGFVEGSGALIDVDKRLVITTYRVVEDSDSVFVQFPIRHKDGYVMTDREKYLERIPTGRALKGKVLFRDSTRDLALIQLERIPANVPALWLAPSNVRIGERVLHVGNREDSRKQTFAGTIHTVRAIETGQMGIPVGGVVLPIRCRFITTAPSSADSGGPMIDRRGHLVAISEGGALGVSARNLNLSIDVSEIRQFLAERKVTIKMLPKTDASPPDKPMPDNERAAADRLRVAKLFAQGEDNRPYYVAKLKEVISRYPGTEAARAAQMLLDNLK